MMNPMAKTMEGTMQSFKFNFIAQLCNDHDQAHTMYFCNYLALMEIGISNVLINMVALLSQTVYKLEIFRKKWISVTMKYDYGSDQMHTDSHANFGIYDILNLKCVV